MKNNDIPAMNKRKTKHVLVSPDHHGLIILFLQEQALRIRDATEPLLVAGYEAVALALYELKHEKAQRVTTIREHVSALSQGS